MTFFTAAILGQIPAQQLASEMPEPRSPEEVMSLLGQEEPQGEYSVDAF